MQMLLSQACPFDPKMRAAFGARSALRMLRVLASDAYGCHPHWIDRRSLDRRRLQVFRHTVARPAPSHRRIHARGDDARFCCRRPHPLAVALPRTETALKLLLGLAIAFAIGFACRAFGVPSPAPPVIVGALLVVAMTIGYLLVDRALTQPAQHAIDCGGPSGLAPSTEQAAATTPNPSASRWTSLANRFVRGIYPVAAVPAIRFIALLGLCAAYLQGGLIKLVDLGGAVAEAQHFGLPFAASIAGWVPSRSRDSRSSRPWLPTGSGTFRSPTDLWSRTPSLSTSGWSAVSCLSLGTI